MKITTLHDSLNETLIEVQERFDQGGIDFVGIPTGFHVLDKNLLGLRKKAVYVVGARSSIGKSAFAISVGTNVAKAGYKVLYISLEMSAELIALRILSGLTQIPSSDIETGKLTRHQMKYLHDAKKSFENMNFSIVDQSMNSENLVEEIKAYQQQHGLDLLIVDYVALFRDQNLFGDVERIGRISNNINSIANDCDIPVLSLAQLNREADKREDHTPVMSDLRSSGDLEQDAFAVLLLTRPHYYAMLKERAEPLECEDDAQIIIAKNRQGATGMTRAKFYPLQMRWSQEPPTLTQPRKVGT